MFRHRGLLRHVTCPFAKCDVEQACFFQHAIAAKRKSTLSGSTVAQVGRRSSNTSLHQEKRRKLHNASGQETRLAGDQQCQTVGLSSSEVQEREIVSSIVRNPANPKYVSSTPKSNEQLRFDPLCKIPHEQRLKFHDLFRKEFSRIYGNLPNPPDHATEQENYFKKTCTPLTYRAAATNGLLSLRKRPLAKDETDTGIFPEWQIIAPKDLTWANLVHSVGELRNWGYCLEIPTSDGEGDELGHDRVCDRCAERFIVSKDKWNSCTYHPTRPVYKKVDGTRITTWPCCEQTGTGCVVGHTHVFKITHEPRLAAYQPYRRLPMRTKENLDVAALDCEMVYTTASMELARVSVISSQGDILLDRFVKPAFPVLDLNTTYSGVMQHNLDGAISFEEMHQQLIHIGMHRNTILIGHGLDNDLTALRLVHHRVIDSAILFPHPRGRPYRLKLKDLSSRYLARQIQVNDSATGHDPTEDALAALDLVRWRLVNGNAKKIEPFQGKLR